MIFSLVFSEKLICFFINYIKKAMDNCEALRTIVQIHDRPILKKLKDVR